jgi:uncharacterized protein YabE (DUF348 family)
MKFVHKSISSILSSHIFGIGIFALLFGFFFFAGGLVIANSQTIKPDDSHVVSLYVEGEETTVPTRAATVSEFLDKVDVNLYEADLVEPSVETKIDADNFKINVYRARPVTIVDGNKVQRVLTPHESPQLIVEKAGIKVYPEDEFKVETADNFVQESILGEKLIIDRATVVTMSLFGSPPTAYRTQASTVSEFLQERGIELATGANVTPSLDTAIKENLAIFVSEPGKTVIVTEEDVPFSTVYQMDANKPVGYKEILIEGVNGKKQVIYEVDSTDPSNRKIIQEVVILQPKSQEMIVGSKTEAFGGDFADALSKLRSCEGAYTSNTGNGYYGAYQFNLGTWRSNAPAGYEYMLPSEAPPAVQDQAATNLYHSRGWQPWPSCSRSLGLLDIYR